MRQKLWLIVVVILQLACSSHTASAQTDADRINELVTAYVRQYKFNGTVLVVNKGQVVFSKGFGFKSVKDSTWNDVNTIYQLGSVTKQFTAAVILQLQEQKKLSVQDKLGKYFPELPGADTITIEHLLTHTSGIFNYTNDGTFMATEAVKSATPEKIIALFKDRQLDFRPGTKWSYSNSGYMLLGYIIEKVMGQPYEQAVRERIFKPLGMTHSGFDFTHLTNINKATGYTVYKEKMKVQAGIVDSSVSFAAGAIYSTVNDLWEWHKGLLKNTVLKAASLEKAYTPYMNKYGYGWTIDTVFGKKIMQHGGGIFGFNTNFARIPADDLCVVLLSNMNTGALGAINESILAILYNRPYEVPKEKVAIKVDAAVLQQYAGEYELKPGLTLTVRVENGALKGLVTGQPEFDMYAETENKFFLKVVDATCEFVKDADGKVNSITWKQGATIQAKRIK
ncbi:serine hydrolase [Paraflavitalea soli]|uniref:Serine hydrolase n=1 Tax=Paraflavitalea soli TaxID=2315862 RepID=A0A3B7MLC7_9BACT|nr:serine hydrolase [Paraflavitalea soli]AXY75008.1 serine hydrolase [Paraflavitalea soli]